MISFQAIINQVYLLSVILFIFFYGYRILFAVMKQTKIRGEIISIITFIILIIVLSVSIDFLANFLLRLGVLGQVLIIIIYVATYFEFKREMRRK